MDRYVDHVSQRWPAIEVNPSITDTHSAASIRNQSTVKYQQMPVEKQKPLVPSPVTDSHYPYNTLVIKYVATATTPCETVRVKNRTSFVGLQSFR